MRILNLTQRRVLADRVKVANHFWDRLRGLIGRPPLEKGEGLWLPFCQGIHTFGMSYAIDVIFLDSENKIIRARRKVPPNSLGPIALRAASVLELCQGSIKAAEVQLGDVLSFV